MIDEQVDDFSLCLLVIIYLKRKLSINNLLNSIDTLLKDTSNSSSGQSRFSGKLWFLRYFIYYLIQVKIIDKKDVNRYCKNQGIPSGNNGYKSELISKYIFTQGNQQKINEFYKSLLTMEIALVDCGKNKDFKYF